MTTLVDGGYILWTFGAQEEKQKAWPKIKWQFSKKNNAVIIMDGGSLFRNEYFPDYKIKRKVRRDTKPEWQERTDRVKKFAQEVVTPDEDLRIIKFVGHEADDIIALYCALEAGKTRVIGVDKDLMQLGDRIELRKHNGDHIDFKSFGAREPKGYKDFITSPLDILTVLVLMGDSSDSVPRIIPKGGKEFSIMARILQEDNPLKAATLFYDRDDIIRNLYLTLLPGPWVFDSPPPPEEVFLMMTESDNPFQEYINYGGINLEIMKAYANMQNNDYFDIDEAMRSLGYD